MARTLKKGSRGDDVKRLQAGLASLGYHPGAADGVFGGRTAGAVSEFQSSKRILADGIVGPTTAKKFNATAPDFAITLDSPPPIAPVYASRLSWVRSPADKVEGYPGFSRVTLRSDVAEAYMAMYNEIHDLGGVVTTAGGRRGLAAKASPARSKKSLHYVGRAFDLALPTGMQDPTKDPYVIVRGDHPRRFVVWCRLAPGRGGTLELMNLEGVKVTTTRNRRGKRVTQLSTVHVVGRFVNFTDIAKKHGFMPIGCRRSFLRGGGYGGAEWWHFQWERGLVEGVTTFGEELLRVYPLARAKRHAYWDEASPARWHKEWF